ncbi:MAG: RNA polymerase sigma factor [Gammaproteobacteria bacterium]|nr:RNA polymerase sigma factor [Gammaproteobacteria bacterium]
MSRELRLIARVLAHDDHEAFAALVRLHQSAVRRFLRRLTAPDWSRADDLAQETFWKAYRHLASFQGRGRFSSWLFGIAYQVFITQQRRASNIAHLPLPDDLPHLEDAALHATQQHTFDQLLDALRPEERTAIVLHYQHELTHPEIAAALQAPLGTIKTLLRRARLKLQQLYGDRR